MENDHFFLRFAGVVVGVSVDDPERGGSGRPQRTRLQIRLQSESIHAGLKALQT